MAQLKLPMTTDSMALEFVSQAGRVTTQDVAERIRSLADSIPTLNRRVYPGTVIAAMNKLENNGYIAPDGTIKGIDGRTRNAYCLTEKGREILEAHRSFIKSLINGVLVD